MEQTKLSQWAVDLIALSLVTKQFLRPVGSFIITAAGIYLHLKQIPTDTALHALLDGAFPGWMASRHAMLKKEP